MTIFHEVTGGREPGAVREMPPRRQWWKERRFIAIAAVALLLALFLFWKSCHRASGGEGDPKVVVTVQVAKAERAPISNEITTVATLAARREATIMPKISAQIAQMALVKNRHVHEGDVIAVLESRDLAAQRAEAAAAVQEANASAHETVNGAVPLTNAQDEKAVRDARGALENARRTFERRGVLFDEGGISRKELEASKQALINAENDLHVAETSASVHRGTTNPGDIVIAESRARQARDHLANLDAQLGYSVIRAPFAGTVTEQFQYHGDFANPSTRLVTVADASSLIAKVQVGEATAAKLKVGDAVRVFPDELPSVAVVGKIDLVGSGADAQSRSVEVWISVPNPAGRLRPNGLARVVIASESILDAIVVPSAAVTLDATNGNSGTVMVVDAKSIAHEVHVTIGRKSGGRTQITSGLQGGELVVIEGNYGLPDGTEVAVPKAEAPKAEAADPAK